MKRWVARLRWSVITVSLIALLSVSSVASGTTTLTDALMLALENNPQIVSSELQVEEAQTGYNALRSGLLGWRADANVGSTLTKDQQMGMTFQTDDAINALSATLLVRKALGIGPETQLTLDETHLNIGLSERELQRNAVQTIIDTYSAYRGLELAHMQKALAEEALNIAASALDIAEDRIASGSIAPVEAEEARLRRVEAENRLRGATQMQDIARRGLIQLTGADPALHTFANIPIRSFDDVIALIEKSDNPFRPAVAHPWFQSEEEMIREALRQRSELQDARALVTMGQLATEKVRVDNRPRFEIRGEYSTTDQLHAAVTIDSDWIMSGRLTKVQLSHDIPDPLDIAWDDIIDSLEDTFPNVDFPDPNDIDEFFRSFQPEPEPTWEIGVSVTVNLWDSHVASRAAERGQIATERALIGLAQAEKGIELDVLARHAALTQAYSALLLGADEVILARDRLNVEKEKQALGLSTDILVQNAEINQWMKVVEALSLRFDYELAVLEMAQAKGMNPDELLDLAGYLQRW